MTNDFSELNEEEMMMTDGGFIPLVIVAVAAAITNAKANLNRFAK